MSFPRLKEHARTLWLSPPVRIGAAALLALALVGYAYHWSASHEAPATPTLPQPIVQGNQLRFPANHPQLALLGTVPAVTAQSLQLSLPARLVWNEERTQRLFPAFAGRVLQMQADLGQRVQAGQVLATLASPEFGAAQADAAKAQADAEVAERAFARLKTLFDADVISRKELELAQADLARARAEQARAMARTQLYGSHTQINQSLGLRALIPGLVVERNLSAGQEVRPDQSGPPLFVISDPSSLWIEIDAREADVAALRPGTAFSLTLPNFPDRRFQARIAATGDFIDSQSRTVKVRGVIDNRERLLKAEMLGTARIERAVQTGVLVPASAVQLRGTEHWCFVQTAPGVFESRQVQLGYEGVQEVLVIDGLRDGEQVVKDNSLLLAREFRVAQEEARIKAPQ